MDSPSLDKRPPSLDSPPQKQAVMISSRNNVITTEFLQPSNKKVTKFDYPSNEFVCRFCGGKSCHHEIWTNNPVSVIKGIDTDWIVDSIMASQRPSTRLINEYDIMTQLKSHKIHSIVNLQVPGEHPNCGDGIQQASGFSYLPEEINSNGLLFYNFGWPDQTITTFQHILNIIQVMDHTITNLNKKVLVHCHAGRGRTAVVICCYMIYFLGYNAKQSIDHFRNKRRISLKKPILGKFIHQFAIYLADQKTTFGKSLFSYEHFTKKQSVIILDGHSHKYKLIPWVIVKVLQRLKAMLSHNPEQATPICHAFFDLSNDDLVVPYGPWKEKNLTGLKDKVNQQDKECFQQTNDPRVLVQLLLDFLDQFKIANFDQDNFLMLYYKLRQCKFNVQSALQQPFMKRLRKSEFNLLDKLSKFMAKLFQDLPMDSELRKAVTLRVGVSLFSIKGAQHKLFNQRDLRPESRTKSVPLLIFFQETIECLISSYSHQTSNASRLFSRHYSPMLNVSQKKAKPKLRTVHDLQQIQETA